AFRGEVRYALAEILAVRGVLPHERDAGGPGQPAGLLLLVDPGHERRAEQLDRRHDAEQILVAAFINLAGGAAAVDVWHPVLRGPTHAACSRSRRGAEHKGAGSASGSENTPLPTATKAL